MRVHHGYTMFTMASHLQRVPNSKCWLIRFQHLFNRKDLKENGGSSTPVRASRFASEVIKTPLKTEASSNCISVLPESASSEFKLVATPVRRSNRPKSMHLPARAQHHHVLYVDDLSQLSPKTQANLELRSNKALLPSNNWTPPRPHLFIATLNAPPTVLFMQYKFFFLCSLHPCHVLN